MSRESKWPFWTVTTVTVALVGIIAPIIWDLYKGRSELEIQLLSTASLVSKAEEVKNLRILYGDREISELTRATFLLVNSGRHPIRDTEIIEDPKLRFSGHSAVLEVVVEKLEPSNLKVSVDAAGVDNSIKISFPLLNAGDFAQFSVLMNGPMPNVWADARISGVKQLKYVDRRAELSERQNKLGWVFWVVSVFTMLFLGAGFVSFRDYRRSKRRRLVFAEIRHSMVWPNDKVELINYLRGTLCKIFPESGGNDSVESQMRVFRSFIEKQEGDVVTPLTLNIIQDDVDSRLRRVADNDRGGVIAGGVICFIGVIYILYKLNQVSPFSAMLSEFFS